MASSAKNTPTMIDSKYSKETIRFFNDTLISSAMIPTNVINVVRITKNSDIPSTPTK